MKSRMAFGVDAPYISLIWHHMKTSVILDSGSLDHQEWRAAVRIHEL